MTPHTQRKGGTPRNMMNDMGFKAITNEIVCKQKIYSSLIPLGKMRK